MTSKARKPADEPAADETQVSGFVMKPAEPKPDPDVSGAVPWGGEPGGDAADPDQTATGEAKPVEPVAPARHQAPPKSES